jgi:hypothetical protein
MVEQHLQWRNAHSVGYVSSCSLNKDFIIIIRVLSHESRSQKFGPPQKFSEYAPLMPRK